MRGPTSLFRTKKYGRRPGAVVKAACLESRRYHSGLQVSKKQMFLPCSLAQIQYCGEPLSLRSSVLGLRPPGLEFRILCWRQCHLIHFTILRRFSWPNLAYMCKKLAWSPNHFISYRNIHVDVTRVCNSVKEAVTVSLICREDYVAPGWIAITWRYSQMVNNFRLTIIYTKRLTFFDNFPSINIIAQNCNRCVLNEF